ncbi:hypothetical protein H0H93_003250, partial [Arthromyces matolae]
MKFNWVRNIIKKLKKGGVKVSNIEASTLFAVAWQLMRSQVPDEVLRDFNEFVSNLGIYRMDGGLSAAHEDDGQLSSIRMEQKFRHDRTGTLSLDVEGKEFQFSNVELAPPAGVIGQNYS